MTGIKAYRKIQLGFETTAGTEANATVLWRGVGIPDDQLEVVFADEDIGFVSGANRTYVSKIGAGLEIESTPATFQQLPYLLTTGVKSLKAGVADGTGSDYIYAYPFPVTAANTVDTLTVEGGDNQQEEQFLYGFTKSIKLTGNPDEALMVSATLGGRQLSPGTFTAAVPVPTVQEILFNKGKLYIDPAASTIGTTLKPNTFLGLDMTIDTGWNAVQTADGNLFFSFIKHTRESMNITANITFEHDASPVTEKAAWRAQSPRKIRMVWEGNAFTTVGTAHSNYKLIIDMAGKWESFEKIGENNGNDTVAGTFRAQYDPTAALFCVITVVNESSAL